MNYKYLKSRPPTRFCYYSLIFYCLNYVNLLAFTVSSSSLSPSPLTTSFSKTISPTTTTSTTMNKCTKPFNTLTNQIYSRKKRYLLFTDGSAIVATFAIAKAMQTSYPRGVNLIIEADFSYPLQTKLADWYPKKKPMIKHKIDESTTTTTVSSIINTNNYYNSYYSKYHPQLDSWYEPMNRTYGSQYSNQNQQKQSYKFDQFINNIPHTQTRTLSQHHEGYHHRRSLYGTFESIAKVNGIDIKSCLLRLICEVRHYLLPPGKSFFQDVLRILFYVPIGDDISDEYGQAMRSTHQDCTFEYRKMCGYSILGFLLHPKNNNSYI